MFGSSEPARLSFPVRSFLPEDFSILKSLCLRSFPSQVHPLSAHLKNVSEI